MPAKSELRLLLLPLVLGVLARLLLALPVIDNLADPDQYLPLARSLAAGSGFCLSNGEPTAYRPPLYPLLLSPLVAVSGTNLGWAVMGLHSLLGGLTVVLTYVTARRWRLSVGQSLFAAFVVALDPVAVVQSRSVMTETFAAFLVALSLAGLTLPGRRGMLAGGAAIGLCVLCRPSLLPWGGLLVLVILAQRTILWRERAIQAAVFAASVFVVTLPWAARNAWLFGTPIWTTTHGGYTLALANNPVYYADVLDGPPGAVWSGVNQEAWFEQIRQETVGMTQPQADRYLSRQGWSMLWQRPGDFARASVARLGRFWGVAPSSSVYGTKLRLATAVWALPLWALMAAGFLRPEVWKQPRLAAPLLLISLTIVHAIYWTDMRMRVPTIPAIALVAAGSLAFWPRSWGKPARAP